MYTRITRILLLLYFCPTTMTYWRRRHRDAPIESYLRIPYNWSMLQQLERASRAGTDDDYEIVYPFQVRDRVRIGIDTTNYLYTNASIHHASVQFVIKTTTGRLRIAVERNDVIMPEGALYRQMIKAGVYNQLQHMPPNCYYQGHIVDDENSVVALSTCYGLRGAIFTNDTNLVIVPLRGGDRGKRHPHVLFKARSMNDDERQLCANDDHGDWAQVPHRHRARRDSTTTPKYVELGVVVDDTLAREWEYRFQPLLEYVLESVNVADAIWRQQMNTRLSLTFVEASTQADAIPHASDIMQMLLNFVPHVGETSNSGARADLTQLWTWHRFERNEVTMASPMCRGENSTAAGVITAGNIFEPVHTALIASHNVAHSIGLRHDTASTDACVCVDSARGCQLSDGVIRASPTMSACTKAAYHRRLGGAHLQCLFNEPLKVGQLSMCGNGIVDPGEECDCGMPAQCTSRCCDAATCKLNSGARCDAGACCVDCQPLSNETLCRLARAPCDVAEYCTGNDGECPEDSHLIDGSSCGVAESLDDVPTCWRGECRSRQHQCMRIWGEHSRRASVACYEHFNSMGVSHGHCGIDKGTQQLRACAMQNAECGSLHCTGGRSIPTLDQSSVGTYVNTAYTRDGTTHTCKTITALPLALVADGSSCANSTGICLHGACVPRRDLPPPKRCPSNNVALICSGRGSCATSGACVCENGYAGEDCSIRTPIGTRSAPNGMVHGIGHTVATVDTTTMLIILGGVAAGVLLLLLLLLACYRRRTTSKATVMNGVNIGDSDSASASGVTQNRAIKFAGNMPSYRDEKRRKRKMSRQAQIHDLSKIDERSNEQDSVSVKSTSQVGSNVGTERSRTPEAPRIPPPAAPDRGILKSRLSQGTESAALLSGYESDAVVYCGPHGSLRLFEVQYFSQGTQKKQYYLQQRSVGRLQMSRHSPPSPSRSDHYAQHRRQRLTAYRPTPPPNGYNTDTDDTHAAHLQHVAALCTPKQLRRRLLPAYDGEAFSVDGQVPPPYKTSPTSSIASASSTSRLGKPAPLKLRNIEFLLKQLEEQTSEAPARLETDALVGDARSSQQSSNETEQNSHTESHRDALLAMQPHYACNGGVEIVNISHDETMHSYGTANDSLVADTGNECMPAYSMADAPHFYNDTAMQRPNRLNLLPP